MLIVLKEFYAKLLQNSITLFCKWVINSPVNAKF